MFFSIPIRKENQKTFTFTGMDNSIRLWSAKLNIFIPPTAKGVFC
jgi:hypothetical protein